eukprot:CAMPEP_0181297986 /NCGR_PEP_ID=MMETSP1101-20121128/5541_1 /TAXON_ID=46948 /ORGANISM="Rhodomonas abbreviata, Strain Caron Lab Isolate" /LENGTH=258 /DNA_ID=CAMNT_0023402977 /DNA_START=106 /DNA_END=879 /DNA_ORIENTATION=+
MLRIGSNAAFFALIAFCALCVCFAAEGVGVEDYARKVASAQHTDIMRQAAFDNTVDDENKEIHKEESLAMQIEAEDAARDKKEELHKLAIQMTARSEARKRGEEQLEEENKNIAPAKPLSPQSSKLHWGRTGHTGAKEMRRVAVDSYAEYKHDLAAAQTHAAHRESHFEEERAAEQRADQRHAQQQQSARLQGQRKRAEWETALAAEKKRDASRHHLWQAELEAAKKLLHAHSASSSSSHARVKVMIKPTEEARAQGE